jgi:hypothetical protein
MNQDNSSEDELNRYGVPIWLIEALKGYDSLMSSPKGQIKVNKMKAKRELYQLITLYTKERERLAQLNEVRYWHVRTLKEAPHPSQISDTLHAQERRIAELEKG